MVDRTRTFALRPSDSSASIEQAIEWQDGGGPITVSYRTRLGERAFIDAGGQATVTADLKVDSLCSVSATIRAGPAMDDFVTCDDRLSVHRVLLLFGRRRLSITGIWAAGHVGDGLTCAASLGCSLVTGGGDSFVSGLAHGSLSISVGGAASYAFSSPSFLTVPEPEEGEVGVAGLLALFLVGRSRRKTPRSVGRRN